MATDYTDWRGFGIGQRAEVVIPRAENGARESWPRITRIGTDSGIGQRARGCHPRAEPHGMAVGRHTDMRAYEHRRGERGAAVVWVWNAVLGE